MKKIIALFLCFLMSVVLFCGCGGSSGDKKDGSNNETPSNGTVDAGNLSELESKYIGADGPISLVDGDSVKYRVVRPKETLDEITKLSAEIVTAVKGKLGGKIANVTDASGDNGYEILLGETNRAESAQAKELLVAKGNCKDGDFIICAIGKKICVIGVDDAATVEAVKYFTANYADKAQIDQMLCYYNLCPSEGFADITLGSTNILSKYSIVHTRYNISYMEMTEIKNLQKSIKEKTAYVVYTAKDKETKPTEYEIIIGNAEREGVIPVTNRDEYQIIISGNKVFVNGGSTYARSIAIAELNKLVKEGKSLTENVSGTYSETIKKYDDNYLKYVYGDEFDGSTLDMTKWKILETNGSKALDGRNSRRTKDNIKLQNGYLIESGTYDDSNYNGAYIYSQDKMRYLFGYTEISARVTDGDGFWAGFWCRGAMNMSEHGTKYPGTYVQEVDIFECFGNANWIAGALHIWPNSWIGMPNAPGMINDSNKYHISISSKELGQNNKTYLPAGETFNDEFHTIGFYWDEKGGKFIRDGEVYYEYDYGNYEGSSYELDLDAFVEQPMYVIISLAVGLPHGSTQPDISGSYWSESNQYITDYFHLYQNSQGILDLDYRG